MSFDDYRHVAEATALTSESATSSSASDNGNIEPLIASFPTTRFYGSKRRLLGWIYEVLKDLPFSTVLDGFGGTASVSLLFKKMGKRVTYHDGLLFNTLAAHALLADRFPFSNIGEAYSFIDNITPHPGFISETFAGMYYTDEENSWLDGAAKAIQKVADPAKQNVYLYSLFQACLKKRPFNLFHRANLNLRLNQNITRSFGNSTTWERKFSELMKASLPDIERVTSTCQQPITILPHGDIVKLRPGYDLVYLDPPYISASKTTDDYLKRYHFLEGLSNYSQWGQKIDKASAIKSFQTYPYISEWQNKKNIQDKLFGLINYHRESTVVLSYVACAHPTEDEIEGCFNSNFRRTKVFRREFCHALAKEKKTELLFIGSN